MERKDSFESFRVAQESGKAGLMPTVSPVFLQLLKELDEPKGLWYSARINIRNGLVDFKKIVGRACRLCRAV